MVGRPLGSCFGPAVQWCFCATINLRSAISLWRAVGNICQASVCPGAAVSVSLGERIGCDVANGSWGLSTVTAQDISRRGPSGSCTSRSFGMRVAEMNKDAANPLWLCYARCLRRSELSRLCTSTAPLVPLRIPRAPILFYSRVFHPSIVSTNVKLVDNLGAILNPA
jgi:hypothetical protein